jgi:hypothetical protein
MTNARPTYSRLARRKRGFVQSKLSGKYLVITVLALASRGGAGRRSRPWGQRVVRNRQRRTPPPEEGVAVGYDDLLPLRNGAKGVKVDSTVVLNKARIW